MSSWDPRAAAGLALFATVALGACSNPSGPKTEISGQQLYMQYCARCHGPTGAGLADAAQRDPSSPEYLAAQKPLNDKRRAEQLGDERIMGIIRAGRMGPGGKPLMPAFGDEFTEAKLMVITAYVRSLSGAKGDHAAQQDKE